MSTLPPIAPEEFARRLGSCGLEAKLDEATRVRLLAHYEELRRWAPRVDLVGPSAAGEIVERHYAEGLAALPWLPDRAARLVDLGSGAGFPGLVLAAARPDLEIFLIEPRARRAAFLAAAARRMRLSVRVLDARVSAQLPTGFPNRIDRLTVRALRLDSRTWAALRLRLAPEARLLSWSGEEPPELPSCFRPGRSFHFPGSERRYLREFLFLPEAA